METFKKRVTKTAKRFRILKDWRIKAGTAKDIDRDRVWIGEKARLGIVYLWGGDSSNPEPKDYVLHEVLHCALRAFTMLDKRRRKECRQAEEELIQDICSFYTET